MGADFNFTEWCNVWLKTSGSNILEPVVEFNDDSTIKSLKIRQLCDLRGKNRLRMQKLDVGLFNENMELVQSETVVLSSSNDLTIVETGCKFWISAIIINHIEHAYTAVTFDPKTLYHLSQNLS
jgi:hypothetical protein